MLHQSTRSIEGVENVTAVAELGYPPMPPLALVVENVMADAVVYRSLTRRVEGVGDGTAEEERCRTDRTKTALPSTDSLSHECGDMAVDSLLFELLVASPAYDLVEAAAVEHLRQHSTVGCFYQEYPLCH